MRGLTRQEAMDRMFMSDREWTYAKIAEQQVGRGDYVIISGNIQGIYQQLARFVEAGESVNIRLGYQCTTRYLQKQVSMDLYRARNRSMHTYLECDCVLQPLTRLKGD